MKQPYQEPRIGNRRWIAWKLVQIAYRIYNPTFYQRIHIEDPAGLTLFEAVIAGDLYGSGIESEYGPPVELPEGSRVFVDDDYEPDYLEDAYWRDFEEKA
ncbi:hypothetical protein [Mycolicibacterium septicum]|uniref:hypothetical protein n=1 Tax=Mycolicibacterium septicum TaxID=98668 RepID=UPI001AF07A5E|nr:hypothetical protein [Mycolicibacterium septicum]QRY51705.1 hypothetical protein JVX95_30740 [Mycolicibacterium septicum]